MGASYSDRHTFSGVAVDFNTDGTNYVFAPMQPCVIHKVGIYQNGASQTGTASVIFKKRVGASTDTTLATVVTLASTVGKLIYKGVAVAQPLGVINPGDALIVVGTKSGTSTPGTPVIEYSLLDNAVGDNANEVLSA